MHQHYFLAFLLSVLASKSFGQTQSFDDGWKFFRGGAQNAESVKFDDSKWRTVNLPHDWSIEDLPGKKSPFDPKAIGQVGTGFTVGGTGWYRKSFPVSADKKGKRIVIAFDGVYMNSAVWVNGEPVGSHPYGYTGFSFDITEKIRFGEQNIIAVQVRNEGQNSRWYSGSGIYRHVWLKTLDPVHIAPWGIYITTPVIEESSAQVKIRTTVANEANVSAELKIVTHILDAAGEEVGIKQSEETVERNKDTAVNQEITIAAPQLWSPESPVLYSAVSEIYVNGKPTDRSKTKFGIRSISFDAVHGFSLNGKPVKLQGGCVHHDNGPLGSKAYDRAEKRRVEILKAAGFNAIRCSHNPPSPTFLDACDRLGMLVMDEAFDMWRLENNPYDYHLYFDNWWEKDIEGLVVRDHNHPSVILWSIGNEIRDMETPPVIAVEKMLAQKVRQLDPTRPVTAAVNNLRPQKDEFFSNLDVCGYNYAIGGDHGGQDIYAQDHARIPNRVMLGSESYAMETFGAWMAVEDHPYVVGDFVWTAFDYIGEASIGWRGYWQESNFFPWNLAYCGDIDICGWRRPQSFYREALWKQNKLALFVKSPAPSFPVNPARQSWSKWEWHDVVDDWNWKGYERKPLEVSAYSSCEEVELFLNGKSLGKKKTDRSTEFMAHWNVPYQAGELRAVGYSGGKAIRYSTLRTAGKPANLKLSADHKQLAADGEDLSYITVQVCDSNGLRNPKANNLIRFKIAGPGTIIAVGNANPMSLESFQLPERKAWRGKCLVIIKTKRNAGSIELEAFANGMKPAKIRLVSK
jgi:beta-galactosidase